MKYLSMLPQGGPVLVLIGICALIAAFIFIWKWFEFYRAQVDIDEIVTGLINVLRREGMIEAITLCDNSPGPIPRVLSSAIRAYKEGDDIRDSLATQTLIEVPRLESRLNILATLAYVTPLLGLLGTVLGLVDSFQAITANPEAAVTSLPELSKGVYKALLCTAAGLSVAIPCHIAYNYLVSRVQDFCTDMEKASAEIMYFFRHHKKENAADHVE
ncbi:MAG: MotA/TolQ/ExbB proton channel family protein [Lentisphaeria bacterium]|jgi:biopolymer transport protein ExbB|nr:MotA/TolQ/ExbB proton channel family protein [Lentisphaeria bacterium]